MLDHHKPDHDLKPLRSAMTRSAQVLEATSAVSVTGEGPVPPTGAATRRAKKHVRIKGHVKPVTVRYQDRDTGDVKVEEKETVTPVRTIEYPRYPIFPWRERASGDNPEEFDDDSDSEDEGKYLPDFEPPRRKGPQIERAAEFATLPGENLAKAASACTPTRAGAINTSITQTSLKERIAEAKANGERLNKLRRHTVLTAL